MDEIERTRFAKSDHEYVINTVEHYVHEGIVGSTKIDLSLKHPCSALIWFAQRTDFLEKNIYSNYTNWDSKIPPPTFIYKINKYGVRKIGNLSNAPTIYDMYESTSLNTSMMENALQNEELPTKFNFVEFDHDIIQNVTIKYNGIKRIGIQGSTFFNDVQPYQNQLVNRIPGVGLYSFSINPTDLQPSGSCNMSRIRMVQLYIDTIPIHSIPNNTNLTLQHSYKHTVHVYVIHYNEFRIVEGLASLQFQR